MKNNKKTVLVYILIIVLLLLGFWYWGKMMTPPRETLRYDQVIGYFKDCQVEEFSLDFGSSRLNMKLKNGDIKEYYVPYIPYFREDIKPYVDDYNTGHPDAPIKFDYIPEQQVSAWVQLLLPNLLMIILMVVFFFLIMRQAAGRGDQASLFGKAKIKPIQPSDKRTMFSDVAGCEEEKAELQEVVEFLKNPNEFNSLGARIPKGVLLMGPPGTGKTLLAKAVAGEAGVPFFSISGSDFVEMFVGVGASRVRDIFEQAKKNSPSIIFIDEIDAVGRHRGAGLGGGHDEREQTLNQLLVEMDGFGANEGVIVMAATNRKDILDPALLRPGRFDRQIVVGYPDVDGREAILKVHSRNKPLAPDVELKTIAKQTVGFTGADLANLLNEAALLAARKKLKAITMEEIEEATVKVVMGPEKKSKVISDKDKRLTAYHEGGHAVTMYYTRSQGPVHEITIIPRGMAGGYTMPLPDEDKTYVTKKDMQDQILTLLGGRLAEKLIFEDVSTGASNDIERATQIARDMVTRYGFSEKLGPIVYGNDQNEVFLGRDLGTTRNYSENVAAEIDSEVREIIETAYEGCKEMLLAHMDQLHLVAKFLMKYEKMNEIEFKTLMEGGDAFALHEDTLSKKAERDAQLAAIREQEAKAAAEREKRERENELEKERARLFEEARVEVEEEHEHSDHNNDQH